MQNNIELSSVPSPQITKLLHLQDIYDNPPEWLHISYSIERQSCFILRRMTLVKIIPYLCITAANYFYTYFSHLEPAHRHLFSLNPQSVAKKGHFRISDCEDAFENLASQSWRWGSFVHIMFVLSLFFSK